jgi:hypothetical protein
MKDNSQPGGPGKSWDPGCAGSPWSLIIVGLVVCGIGVALIGGTPDRSDQSMGLIIVIAGAAITVVGAVATGVEIALRRTQR